MQKVKVVVQQGRNVSRGNWTKDDEETLIEMYNDGVKYTEIAKTLGRSYNSISARAAILKERGAIVVGEPHEDFKIREIVQEDDTAEQYRLSLVAEIKRHERTKLLLRLIEEELYKLKEI